MVILLNRLTVTGDPEKFEEVFAKSSVFMRAQPGFKGHTLVRSLRNPGSYVNIAHWEQAADHWQSQLLDFGRFEEWAATFTEDGSFLAPGFPEPVRGRTALGVGTRKNHEGIDPTLAIRHWFNMTTVEPLADGAVRALSYVIVIRAPRDGEPFIYRSTTCEDVLAFQDGQWLVRERVIRRDDLPD